MSKQELQLGRAGEAEAIDLLKRNGYKIIARNYRSNLGEIDIIAREKGVLCFVEVKTRKSDRFGLPQEAIDALKQRKISRVALGYLKEKNLLGKKARFDVVSILYAGDMPKMDLIKGAFELSEDFI